MKQGDICTGVVTGIEEFGIFVFSHGMPGLIRTAELSWERICHPPDFASIGDELTFKVLKLNDPNKQPEEHFNGSIRLFRPSQNGIRIATTKEIVLLDSSCWMIQYCGKILAANFTRCVIASATITPTNH